MNPFDLRGPEFLLFYLCFAGAVLLGLYLWGKLGGEQSRPTPRIEDPYLVAYLRGGEAEAVRVAAMSLMDRGLLRFHNSEATKKLLLDEKLLEASDPQATEKVKRPIERQVLEAFAEPHEIRPTLERLEACSACREYGNQLEHSGLVARETLRAGDDLARVIAVGMLVGVAGVKILVALSRGRTNILFLIVLSTLAVIAATRMGSPFRTLRGDRFLREVKSLFANLRARAPLLRPGGATADLVWLASAFGLSEVPALVFPYVSALEKRVQEKTAQSSGALSDSSCGGFSSCGGVGAADREVAAVGVAVAAVTESRCGMKDRVGLGWRKDLAAGIFSHQEEIDVLEVIADDFFGAPSRELDALRRVGSQFSVFLHGVGMGLATSAAVKPKYVDHMARLVEQVRPEGWSEHFAMVRAGRYEIGHLAAPPRTQQNVEGAAENVWRAAKTVGSKPTMENIATLLDPPGSALGEGEWIRAMLEAAGCDLLFDLHNVYANGLNYGYDPKAFLRQIPSSRIRFLHIAGGKLISAPDGTTRILDDHLHDAPDPVFELLEEVATVAPNPLTVVLERDGRYPAMEELLGQLSRARKALARGRARRAVLEAAA